MRRTREWHGLAGSIQSRSHLVDFEKRIHTWRRYFFCYGHGNHRWRQHCRHLALPLDSKRIRSTAVPKSSAIWLKIWCNKLWDEGTLKDFSIFDSSQHQASRSDSFHTLHRLGWASELFWIQTSLWVLMLQHNLIARNWSHREQGMMHLTLQDGHGMLCKWISSGTYFISMDEWVSQWLSHRYSLNLVELVSCPLVIETSHLCERDSLS